MCVVGLCSQLFEGIEKCDQQLCHGMQLVARGSIMRYNNIAFIGKPIAPSQDEACKNAPEGPLSTKGDFSNTGKPATPTAAATAAASPGSTAATQYLVSDEPGIYTGSGDIYTGDMWVSGGLKTSRFERGSFQLVYLRELDSNQPHESVPDNHFVAKAYTLDLELYSS